jgi:hypothetical protein
MLLAQTVWKNCGCNLRTVLSWKIDLRLFLLGILTIVLFDYDLIDTFQIILQTTSSLNASTKLTGVAMPPET